MAEVYLIFSNTYDKVAITVWTCREWVQRLKEHDFHDEYRERQCFGKGVCLLVNSYLKVKDAFLHRIVTEDQICVITKNLKCRK